MEFVKLKKEQKEEEEKNSALMKAHKNIGISRLDLFGSTATTSPFQIMQT